MPLLIDGIIIDEYTTVERDALVLPASRLMIYNSTDSQYQVNDGTPSVPVWTASSNINADDIDTSGTTNQFVAAGDLTNLGNLSGINTGDEVQATTTIKGIAEIATQTEVDAGTDDTRIVTPLKLSNYPGLLSSDQQTLITGPLGTVWNSGLQITTNSPEDQTVDYTSGDYFISSVLKTIGTGGNFDLTSSFSFLANGERMYVAIVVDVDQVIEKIDGTPVSGTNKAEFPAIPVETVCLAQVLISKTGGGANNPIFADDIIDCRLDIGGNTAGSDEFVKISSNDTASKYLEAALSNNGNVTFTVENEGGNETIKADAPVGEPTVTEVSATALTTTTSTSYVQVTGMGLTPIAAGTYMVWFSSTVEGSTNNTMYEYAIFAGGTEVAHTERHYMTGGGQTSGMEVSANTQGLVTVNGAEAIEIRWKAGAGTMTMYERTLNIMKVS